MSQVQTTLGGERHTVDLESAAWPDDADERTPFGGVYIQADGDKTIALHRCPACGVAVNPHRWPSERTAEPLEHHLLEKHDSLEDFGGVDLHDEQRKLPLAGELVGGGSL